MERHRTTAPTVSVIIPVYNAEAFLAEAIESVLGQHMPPQQVIVVDDGSTDQSAQVARRYAKHILLVQQPNAGGANARNRGVALAKGDFLAFLEHDDYWLPEKLTLQLEAFRANPELDAVYGQTKQSHTLATIGPHTHYFAFDAENGCHLDTLLIRQAAFWRVGPFDPAWRFDTVEWMWRARRQGICTQILPAVLAWRRIHGDNLSIRARQQAHAEYLRLIRTVLHQQRHALSKTNEKGATGPNHRLTLAEGA